MYEGVKDKLSREDQIKLLMFDQERLVKEGHPRALCWFCKKAVPDPRTGLYCNWSKEFKPVEGWLALHEKVDGMDTTCVIKCPEFLFDRLN